MAFNYGLRPTTVQMMSSSGTSSQSSAFGAYTLYVRICADADCHILFGSSPTATSSSIFIPADQPEIFKVNPGEKVAAIGSANVSVSELA